jgi:hypothetical protein
MPIYHTIYCPTCKRKCVSDGDDVHIVVARSKSPEEEHVAPHYHCKHCDTIFFVSDEKYMEF